MIEGTERLDSEGFIEGQRCFPWTRIRISLKKSVFCDVQFVYGFFERCNCNITDLHVPVKPVIVFQNIWCRIKSVFMTEFKAKAVINYGKSGILKLCDKFLQIYEPKEKRFNEVAFMAARDTLISLVRNLQIFFPGNDSRGCAYLPKPAVISIPQAQQFNSIKHNLILAIKNEVCND